MKAAFSIGVDGGGTKTDLIAVGVDGAIIARHRAPGCNPSATGTVRARSILEDAIKALLVQAPPGRAGGLLLCMAGSRSFWRETASDMERTGAFGPVTAMDDSLPVLELATGGRPGMVMHAGTGSFIAARTRSGKGFTDGIHYAGGLGWRIGDMGSGYDIGRRGIGQALMELQGWVALTGLGPALQKAWGAGDCDSLLARLYTDPDANGLVAGFAPTVLGLAESGEPVARLLAESSLLGLLAMARGVWQELFAAAPGDGQAGLPVGLSGPILVHPVSQQILSAHAFKMGLPFALNAIGEEPVEGIRHLLQRLTS